MTPQKYLYRRLLSRRSALGMAGAAMIAPTITGRPSRAQSSHMITAHNRTPDGTVMGFSPLVLRIAKGDAVQFSHADRGHDINNFDDMRPAGAAGFGGRVGEEFSVGFDIEGTYGFFCRPHRSMGMMGLILVGDFTNNLNDVRAAIEGLRVPPLKKRGLQALAAAEALL